MNLGELSTDMRDTTIVVEVCVESIREWNASRGTAAFVQLKDQYGEVEMVVFSSLYEECRELLLNGEPLVVTATVDAVGDLEDEVGLIATALKSSH